MPFTKFPQNGCNSSHHKTNLVTDMSHEGIIDFIFQLLNSLPKHQIQLVIYSEEKKNTTHYNEKLFICCFFLYQS